MQHRIDWIDALKGFAILTVVIGHCITDSLSSQTFPEYAALLQMMNDAIYSFHMPLFFMISGYVFYLTKSYRKWKTKVLDFSIVYVIWSALMWFSKYMMNGDVNHPVTIIDLVSIVYKPIMIYWYLYVLIILYAIVSCLRWEKVSWRLWSISAVAAIAVKTMQLDIGMLNNVIYHMCHFLAGGVLLQTGLLQKLKLKHAAFLSALVLMNCIFYFRGTPTAALVVAVKQFLIASCLSLLCFWAFSRLGVNAALRVMGVNTLQIYVMHCFFTGGLRILFKHMHMGNIGLYFVMATALGVIVPVFCAKIARKIPLLHVVFEPNIGKKGKGDSI